MKTALTTSIAFIVAFIAGGSFLVIYKAKRWELRDQTQRQKRILETYKNRNLLNSAENGGLPKKKKKLFLNMRTLPKNGTLQLPARDSPPPFENTFEHSYKSRINKIA